MAKVKAYDSADYLANDEIVAAYLSEAFETADANTIAKAIGTVARAKGMTAVAKDAGLSRENLYRALSGDDAKPEFETIVKVLDAMGIQLTAKPKAA